jgi:hypothetical protein
VYRGEKQQHGKTALGDEMVFCKRRNMLLLLLLLLDGRTGV